jgi:hypothetical protein
MYSAATAVVVVTIAMILGGAGVVMWLAEKHTEQLVAAIIGILILVSIKIVRMKMGD